MKIKYKSNKSINNITQLSLNNELLFKDQLIHLINETLIYKLKIMYIQAHAMINAISKSTSVNL